MMDALVKKAILDLRSRPEALPAFLDLLLARRETLKESLTTLGAGEEAAQARGACAFILDLADDLGVDLSDYARRRFSGPA